MRELVVTGDDFGASPGINDAIERGHREGVLTSASLIATAPEAKDAADRARSLPTLTTGLHLVLCDGRAASPPASIPDLVGPDGRFESDPARAGLRYWIRRRTLRDQLDREIRAQLERCTELGLRLDHVDGHHHLHMHPLIFDLLLARLPEYGVGSVRLMHEDGAGRIRRPAPGVETVVAVHALLARLHRRRLGADADVRAPDRVYGLRATGRMDARTLCRLVERARGDRVEIYLHPDLASDAGRRELEALLDPAVRETIGRSRRALTGSRRLAAVDLR